ncbi:MAG: hypothetical protein J7530_10380, partial [Novosphingobium sp.]|nr:hypothetical protein [Novosphingobium sp.]
ERSEAIQSRTAPLWIAAALTGLAMTIGGKSRPAPGGFFFAANPRFRRRQIFYRHFGPACLTGPTSSQINRLRGF